jgi:hypothetical protein
MMLTGRQALGDGDDRKWTEIMAEELSGTASSEWLEPRLRAMTRMLVRPALEVDLH